MNVLHYSFSLSACPKCHLLICQHTSLADLDFNSIQPPSPLQCSSNTSISIENNSCQQRSSHGTNIYIFPSTISDTRHSWTTCGTDSIESSHTFNHLSSNNETISEAIPFANENILHSSLLLTSTSNQIIRTQSERFIHHLEKSPIYFTRSYSFSTIYNKSTSFTPRKHDNHSLQTSHSSSNRSFLILLILILSFLMTNTLDIVLIYIYYHTNYFYLISFLSTIILCDMILWMNNLIQINNIPSHLLRIPFVIRLYLLYELIELVTIRFDQNDHVQIIESSSIFETNVSQATDTPMVDHSSSYKRRKRRLFHDLTLFYLVHTGFFVFINFYFWSNHFQPSSQSSVNMDYFIPRWTVDDNLLSTTYWQRFNLNHGHLTSQTLPSNWTQLFLPSYIPLSIRLPSSSLFVFISTLYYLLINYSLLSTCLTLQRFSFLILPSILSRLCLIMTRIYTFIFLFRLNIWWLPITFLLIHIILILTLLFDQFKYQQKRNTIFLQLVFSLLTQNSIEDTSIHALISLENISIFLHHLYLEIFSFEYHPTTLRLIIFLSILIGIQIIGFIFDVLSKNILYRMKSIRKI